MTAVPFDYNAPLPDLHIRQQRSWEPAARHYQDVTEAERAAQVIVGDPPDRTGMEYADKHDERL